MDHISTTVAHLVAATTMAPPGHVPAVNETHQMTEGGFLTGRNPFVFIPAAPLPTFIIQLLVIVGMSRLVKLVLSPIKQPAVIAEIISGIVLGPTVMGHFPEFGQFVFPKASLPFLNLMANFGLVLFLFLVGLELDPTMLRKSIKKSFAISFAGMALPFCFGVGSSYVLFHYIEPDTHQQNSFVSYLLFLGVAMAITAFPVLARILSELNLLKTKVGSITISAAAVDDATSWCLLALVISIIHANSNLTAIYVFLMGFGYSMILIVIVRPIFIRCLRAGGTFDQEIPSQASIFFALALVFISAFITDAIGIHAIFGGFIAGIIMPHERGFAYHITEKLEDIVQILFLPLYFALSGLKTKIGTLNDLESWGVVVLVILAACVGKILGCTLAARLTKLNWRESLTVGVLMNCKGLVELIVLNLGYDAGIISDKTFAIMVIMALCTTFITVPAVSYLYPPKYHEIPSNGGSKKKKEKSLLVSVNRIEQVAPMLPAVNIIQYQMNYIKKMSRGKGSTDSNASTGSSGMTRSKGSFASISDMLSIIPGGKSSAKRSGIPINVLRLIELTDRDSSVMLSASQGALLNDPIAKLLKTFCEVTNKQNPVNEMVKVVTMDRFGSVMAQTGEEENAQYILLPWSGSGTIVEDIPARRSLIGQASRRLSMHTYSQHSSFFQELLSQSKTNVAIFVDRGAPDGEKDQNEALSENTTRNIYVPFFGGKDDREVLNLVKGIGNLTKFQVRVIRYKNMDEDRQSVVSTTESTNTEIMDTMGKSINQVSINMDDEDDRLIKQFFGSNGKNTEEVLNATFTESQSYNPVTHAIEALTTVTSSDLVLIGRRSVNMGDNFGNQFKSEDSERRKVLGDFAEALMVCQCPASLLVINAA